MVTRRPLTKRLRSVHSRHIVLMIILLIGNIIVIHYYYKPSALRQEVKFWRNGVSTGLAHTNVTGAGTYKHMKTVFDGAPLVNK